MAPDVYYLTDHYANYPTVLVRLSRIRIDALKRLLGISWPYSSVGVRRGWARLHRVLFRPR